MRADKALMVGVGLLGAFAAFKMLSAKGENAPLPPGDRPTGTGLIMLGDPLLLKQGQVYRARLSLAATTPPFSTAATADAIAQGLSAIGFSNVTIFMTLQSLPTDWPASTMVNPQPATRWFQGTWNGPTLSLPRPATIESIWVRDDQAVATSGIFQRRMTG